MKLLIITVVMLMIITIQIIRGKHGVSTDGVVSHPTHVTRCFITG